MLGLSVVENSLSLKRSDHVEMVIPGSPEVRELKACISVIVEKCIGKTENQRKNYFHIRKNNIVRGSVINVPIDRRNKRLSSGGNTKDPIFDYNRLVGPKSRVCILGGMMENDVAMLRQVNKDAEDSLDLLQDTVNKASITYDHLIPILGKMVDKIKNTRLTTSIELKKSLTVMHDVRKFFLESDYNKEMERLERFVELGERMKALIDDGTMDAVCDISLKLAIGSEKEGK